MERLKVAVLMGGLSAEREVSLVSGRMVMAAMDPARYEVVGVDAAGGALRTQESLPLLPGAYDLEAGVRMPSSAAATDLVPVLRTQVRPDVVFIALHGTFGEDGTVQGLLDLLGVPYTGSGVLASALAMNKAMAKRVLRSEGVPTPDFRLVQSVADGLRAAPALAWPLVVKPNAQGSSVGLTVVRECAELRPALEQALRYDADVLIEPLVRGTEITAAVLGNRELEVLPLVEIVPQGGVYDYEAKYTPGATEEIVPARISEAAARRARDVALRTHRALGCRGLSRVDMMVADPDVWVLEVNTIPGLTETSLLPRAAVAAGISFPALVERLIQLALEGR